MEEKENTKSKIALREEETLKFWKENQIFEKSLEKESPKGDLVFYEGPPTANAKPALHHLEARAFKDVIPRYKTMQGFRVPRRGGWDTHGLPVELQIEKKLGLKSKKEIEKYGVAEFNKQCKESVFEYIGDWENFTDRIGYWIDKKNAYYTFDSSYIEKVWGVLKFINERGLIYKDYKVVPWCPRCGTALSSHELAQGYETVKDLSVTVEFRIKGEKNKSLLAWTTTPWTLPGNVALAVGEKIDYVEIKAGEKNLILAKERLSVIEGEYEVVKEMKGKDLVGLEYEPLYDFFPKDTAGMEKAYKVYVADFVNTEDGTGIVHTAVMYGQDDFELGTKIGLPKYHTVNEDGTFKEGIGFLSGLSVTTEETTVEIIKDLAHRGLLFKKEKYEHQYPHCWRCKTRLVYYARDSWYIKMSGLREDLVKENENINWVPEHIKEGRFGEWLREVKDWAISRERYWGTPLPIWADEDGNIEVVGSIDELKEKTVKSGNKYFVMRHGEAENNTLKVLSAKEDNPHHLTEKGIQEVKDLAEKIKEEKIDLIISSPFVRTRETALIVAEALGLDKSQIKYDPRIGEHNSGDFNGMPIEEYYKYYSSFEEAFEKPFPGGESYTDTKRRTGEFIYELEREESGKNILIVTHESPAWLLFAAALGLDKQATMNLSGRDDEFLENSEMKKLDFAPLPHNENYELDLHKPFIDSVTLKTKDGKELKRVKEVLDVWFDSGSMPFASSVAGYPADFISEAIDQTRGWFYTLHAIGVLMDKGKAYKNVICLGHILDSEGKKMSKSIGNIVDPNLMIAKYGVDSLRLWMYSVNQPGDSKNFDEKTVEELQKKVFNPIENILSFYKLYAEGNISEINSENILDKWIISKLNELLENGSKNLDNYKIFEASRSIKEFANEFSTWYLRRSRDRFKSDDEADKAAAIYTTRFVLLELSKFMAPFTPFFAEYLYGELKTENDPESVHLAEWPKGGEIDQEIISEMEETRKIVSSALEERNKAGIKVRQPLGTLKFGARAVNITKGSFMLIADEVNVKEVIQDKDIKDEVELDIEITEELKKEGLVRDFIRAVQELRKEEGLTPDQKIVLEVETSAENRALLESNKDIIFKPTNVSEIVFLETEGELKIKIK